jgi:hypothetical protein
MRAMRAEAFGGYQDLKFTDIPSPALSDGRVLVRMTASVRAAYQGVAGGGGRHWNNPVPLLGPHQRSSDWVSEPTATGRRACEDVVPAQIREQQRAAFGFRFAIV